MKLALITVFCFLLFNSNNNSHKMFNKDILNKPVQNKEKFEKMFNYKEIGVFSGRGFSNTIILENGYAKSKIINTEEWQPYMENRKVTRIDIIFTKYPFKKEDWITNYHKLLAARLTELFKLDSTLNNKDIEWNLVLQTNCKTASQAKQFFHGILIKFEIIKNKNTASVPDSVNLKNTEKKTTVKIDTSVIEKKKVKNDYEFSPDYSNTRIFKKKRKKQKTKKAPLPDCATFK